MKAGSRPQYYRIRRMVQMVREGAETGYLPNSSDFMKEFEVSRRTVARDLDFLRDEENAPLAYDEARHGFRLTDETYMLPPVRISRREAFSFALARKLLAHYEDTPLHLDMRSVLDKIAESLEGDVTIEPDPSSPSATPWQAGSVSTSASCPRTGCGSIPMYGRSWLDAWNAARRSGRRTRPSTGAYPSTNCTPTTCSPTMGTGT
ncbi:helix-turn-helix transcriptional regulator [Kiritimatiella glycovorans]|uniref:helix-turn-helix transcriptional regulator n=1 Tax=Kiritimatiella glycovorans TaxID=1307763 RepID=UPI000699B362|nr:hypothetical protein [Kiritimatiella glycovorans]